MDDIIKMLAEKIADEIGDAGSYAKMAHEVRGKYPELAKMLNDISNEEMGHMHRLHDAVVKMIDETMNN